MTKQYGIMSCCGAPLVNPVKHLLTCKYYKESLAEEDIKKLLKDGKKEMEKIPKQSMKKSNMRYR